MRWLFHVTPPDDGVENMALDEALMRRAARTGEAVFRVYGWSSPTLSFGRHQRARGCYDAGAAAALGISFVRRPTGGRALMHHHEITYSATMPLGASHEARSAYYFINSVLLRGLGQLGVTAQRSVGQPALAPGPRPCFDQPAEHEIVVGDRKLVGSAQWRRGGALLQHGSILVRDDQPLIARLMLEPTYPATRAATLAESLGFEPSTDDVARALRGSLEDASGCVESFDGLSEMDTDLALLRDTYASGAWTWRC